MTRTESLLTAIACGLAAIGCVLLAVCRDRIAAWLTRLDQRVASRVAVEVVRWRTRGYQGHHAEAFLDDQFADDITRDVIPYVQVNGSPPWVTSPPLRALPPVPDRLDRMVAEFTATMNLPGTGMTPVTSPGGRDGQYGSPGEDKSRQGPGLPGATATRGAQPLGSGEPTPGQAVNLWQPRDTAVDASLLAAIRTEIDGIEYTHQLVDRLFSVIDIGQIFDRALAGVSTS